jgi:hypothetical protein
MAHQQHLYQFTTDKYRDGWRGQLDRSVYVGTVKVLAGRTVREARDYDDGGTALYRVVAPSALRSVDLRQAIRDTMGGSNCRHEHDCCGCASRHVRTRRVSPREYAVIIHTSYNY